jgi:acyl-homoserine-lactone acylase
MLCLEIAGRVRSAGGVTLQGAEVDLRPAADVLEGWDQRFDVDSRGAALWREVMASLGREALASPGLLFEERFDPSHPTATVHLVSGEPNVEDPIVRSVAEAVMALGAASVPLDAPLGEVQWVRRGDRRLSVHGGQEVDGVLNVLEPQGMLPTTSLEPHPDTAEPVSGRTELTGLRHGGYAITYGTSFTMIVEMTPDGPAGRGFLAYGQCSDPESPNFADQVDLYVRKDLRPLLYRDEEIAADPSLTIESVGS